MRANASSYLFSNDKKIFGIDAEQAEYLEKCF